MCSLPASGASSDGISKQLDDLKARFSSLLGDLRGGNVPVHTAI